MVIILNWLYCIRCTLYNECTVYIVPWQCILYSIYCVFVSCDVRYLGTRVNLVSPHPNYDIVIASANLLLLLLLVLLLLRNHIVIIINSKHLETTRFHAWSTVYIVYSVHSLYSVHCIQYIVYSVQCIQCIQCTVYTVYSIQCTLYT